MASLAIQRDPECRVSSSSGGEKHRAGSLSLNTIEIIICLQVPAMIYKTPSDLA